MELLSIDVSSELQTLCEAQLRGTWQVPAELVRLAMRLEVAEVRVQRRRFGFKISWTGPAVGVEVLEALRIALDEDRGEEDRQRAISSLEHSGMEELLWAAGLQGARIRVARFEGNNHQSFVHPYPRPPEITRGSGGDGSTGVAIHWRCKRLDRRRALNWLRIAARFAPATVVVDGRPVQQGFAGGLYHLRLEQPVRCRIGLTRSGDEPIIWLLRNGVVSARASLPGYPPFAAAVELGGLVSTGASAADLRRAVTPYLGELVDRAVWMMMEVSNRLPGMDENDRSRVGLLLLRAARRGLRTHEIFSIPLVGNAADEGLLSVDEIREMATGRGGLVAAVEVGEDPGGVLVDPRSTVVASSEARELLSELATVRFQAPSRRCRRLPRRIAERLRSLGDPVRHRFRGFMRGRPVSEADLNLEENELLAALRRAVSPLEVDVCKGRRAAGRTANGLVVSRLSPIVASGADIVSADSAWIYPLILALDIGENPSDDLRKRWLTSMGVFDPDHVV
jgi:hypothetical protein